MPNYIPTKKIENSLSICDTLDSKINDFIKMYEQEKKEMARYYAEIIQNLQDRIVLLNKTIEKQKRELGIRRQNALKHLKSE